MGKIDEILNSGRRNEYQQLILEVMRDPYGALAQRIILLHQRRNLNDPEFYAKNFLLAAYHLVQAMRQFPGKQLKPYEALELHRISIREIVAAERASNPRVFGSVLRRTDTIASDLDLLVDPDDDISS